MNYVFILNYYKLPIDLKEKKWYYSFKLRLKQKFITNVFGGLTNGTCNIKRNVPESI